MLCILIILSYLQILCDYYAQYLNYLIFSANIIWPLWCLSNLSANIVESLSISLSKVDTASILKKISQQLSIYDADEDLSMASADQRTTTGGLSGTQNSSQGPQISESASVPLMRKSLRNEYQIQTVQKQDENKTGNTKAFPKAQWTQALSALAQSTMFKLQFHYHTISPLIAKFTSKSRRLSRL